MIFYVVPYICSFSWTFTKINKSRIKLVELSKYDSLTHMLFELMDRDVLPCVTGNFFENELRGG